MTDEEWDGIKEKIALDMAAYPIKWGWRLADLLQSAAREASGDDYFAKAFLFGLQDKVEEHIRGN